MLFIQLAGIGLSPLWSFREQCHQDTSTQALYGHVPLFPLGINAIGSHAVACRVCVQHSERGKVLL